MQLLNCMALLQTSKLVASCRYQCSSRLLLLPPAPVAAASSTVTDSVPQHTWKQDSSPKIAAQAPPQTCGAAVTKP
jgi:hypothetical protein